MKTSIIAVCMYIFYCSGVAFSQADSIFSFVEMGIQPGKQGDFADGYARDLEWHKAQGDKWTWLGWFVTRGKRQGTFVDATPYHTWQDFEQWSINPAENAKHNKIHYMNYISHLESFYLIFMPSYSNIENRDWIKSPYLLVIDMSFSLPQLHVVDSLIKKYNANFVNNRIQQWLWFRESMRYDMFRYKLLLPATSLAHIGEIEEQFYLATREVSNTLAWNIPPTIHDELWQLRLPLCYFPVQ